MYEHFAPELLVESRGAVRIVTLNRPDALNAVSAALHDALEHVWDVLAADPEARAVVLTGAGRAFSAGGDINHMVELRENPELRAFELAQGRRIVSRLFDFPLPVVAAVNGPAVGLGCSLVTCCDIVLMGARAFLADPHVAVGLTAGDGGAVTWPIIVGLLRAKEYLLTGDRLTGEQAVACGMASRVIADADLMAEALTLAERLAAQPAHAVQSTKRAINLHAKRAAAGVLEYAMAEEYMAFDTREHHSIVEGMRAEQNSDRQPRPPAEEEAISNG